MRLPLLITTINRNGVHDYTFNTSTITDFYRAYNKSLAEFLDREYTMDIYRQDKLTAFINERTTFMFKTIKQLERTAIEERDRVGDIATITGELLDKTPENDERFELMKKSMRRHRNGCDGKLFNVYI